MKEFSTTHAVTMLLAGAVVVGSITLFAHGPRAEDAEAMSFWEAAGRGLVAVSMVDQTFDRGGTTVTLPVGIRVDNAASVPISITEEPVLLSPHPAESPAPNPLDTTQDAVLTTHTIPAGSSLTYSYGEDVLQGYLPEPTWWCAEEFQFSQGGVSFHVGGEILPFALAPVLANRHYESPDANTQIDFWNYLRSNPAVVVGKDPLWSEIDAAAGQRIAVTLRATNLAIYATTDAITTDVNVTGGAIEDDVPVGWSVEEGSFSTPPAEIVDHDDGSKTLRWIVDLPAAPVSDEHNPLYPAGYVSKSFSYVLVSPALNAGRLELPRMRSDMNRDGTADAHSAAPVVQATSATPLEAELQLTVAGERWHDVVLTILSGSETLAEVRVVREPGDPKAQSASTGTLALDTGKPLSAKVVYTPGDDKVNGKPQGDNPAWLTILFADGRQMRLFHNFNVNHESTWTWTIEDLASLLTKEGIALRADLYDPGSAAAPVTRFARDDAPTPIA